MQTEGLLTQSQQLAGELQNQQVELQQTNEEIALKAALLAEQKAEVENKNQQIEHARRALEDKAAELALTSRYKSEFLANMTQMFRTLLLHAASRDAANARVSVARKGAQVQVMFCDDGPALDATARERLLQAPLVPPPDDGLGLRLLIAKAIALGHGGTLDVQAPADGASLRLRCELPLAE